MCVYVYETSRGAVAQVCDSKRDRLWIRFPLNISNISFLRSGVEVKEGSEFWHSTRNASRIRRKVGSGVSRFHLSFDIWLWLYVSGNVVIK